jgi:hypothetical protein
MTDNKKDRPALSAAPPPMHAVALMTVFFAVFGYMFPSWEIIDEAATVETFTKRVFPDLISIQQLACIRLAIAAAIWAVSFQCVFLSPGWEQSTSYLKGTKLISVPNKLSGIKTMFPFTSLSWNVLGLSFTLSGYIAWKQAVAAEEVAEISPLLLRTALISWEIAGPFTFLVASVIRFAIWPAVLKSGDTANLKTIRNIFMHNMNVIFALTETAMLGGLPVRWRDVSLGPLVGCAYVVFSWSMSCSWNDKKYGPQFIYFFFDTTLPGYTHSIALAVLLLVLMIFYAFFASTEAVLEMILPFGWPAHAAFVLALSSTMMRFRD